MPHIPSDAARPALASAPESARPGWTLADGTFVPRRARGVYWRCHRRGGYFVAYLVDSTGDDCDEERKLPMIHTREEKWAIERELRAILDRMDPVAAPTLRLLGSAD